MDGKQQINGLLINAGASGALFALMTGYATWVTGQKIYDADTSKYES